MSIIISAILIFILLCVAAILAFIVPIEPQKIQTIEAVIDHKTDSVLFALAHHSKNVPAVIGYVE